LVGSNGVQATEGDTQNSSFLPRGDVSSKSQKWSVILPIIRLISKRRQNIKHEKSKAVKADNKETVHKTCQNLAIQRTKLLSYGRTLSLENIF